MAYPGDVTPCYKGELADFILSLLAAIRIFFRSRSDTALEVWVLLRVFQLSYGYTTVR